jgi:preprotein translocase subunit YajC
MLALLLWAEGEAANGGGARPTGDVIPFPLILLILVGLFFMLVIRPGQKRQEQERQALFNTLEKNDEVLTIGGIYATVVSVSEKEDEMIVRLEDNTRMKMTRSSVSRNITKEQKAKEAAQQQTASKEPGK